MNHYTFMQPIPAPSSPTSSEDDLSLTSTNSEYDLETDPFPLLLLPPEIRNKIYRFALTNHHIHIRRLSKHRRNSIPEHCDGFYHEIVPADDPPPPPTLSSLERAFGSSTTRRPERLPQLWRVCKQLHAETVGLPFSQYNIFSFEDAGIFQEFLDYARPEQLNGISKLWLLNKSHSDVALAHEALTENLSTVYVKSTIKKLEALTASRDLMNQQWNHYRVSWELNSERLMVEDLVLCWCEKVKLVVHEI